MDERFIALEKFVMEKISENRMPGLSIALVKDGKIVYSRGFGVRNIEERTPATPDTIYGIGSITKSFTSLGIMQLAEKGTLSLDDPVEDYVSIKMSPFGEPVRIHHLLTHTSGIPSLGYIEAFIEGLSGSSERWLPVSGEDDIIAFAQDAQQWAYTKPGAKFFYSNTGYVLLGKIISKATGMKYEEYIRENILEPLGMNHTHFLKEELEKEPNVATGYVIDRGSGVHTSKNVLYGMSADAGLLSSVLDMAKYMEMYLNRGISEGKEIISKEFIEKMEAPHVKLPEGPFGEEWYGYGLSGHSDFFGQTLIGHTGSVLIYTGYMGYIPGKKLGVVVLANSSGYPLSSIGVYALALMLGRDPESELPFIRKERIFKKLEGTYEGYRGTVKFSVKSAGDFLILQPKGRFMNPIIPLIVEKVENHHVICYTLSRGSKIDVEFHIKDGAVELIYERYKLVKGVHI